MGTGKLTKECLEIQLKQSRPKKGQWFGEAFAELSGEGRSGKDFMSHPGYLNYSKPQRRKYKNSLEVRAVKKMKDHIADVNKVISSEMPELKAFEVTLKIKRGMKDKPWTGKLWTDEDQLYCENLDKLKEHLGIESFSRPLP